MALIRSPDDFRIYAGKIQTRWDLLIGGTLQHPELGIGTVKNVLVRNGLFGSVKIVIGFEENEKTLPADILRIITRMTFPISRWKEIEEAGLDISQLHAPDITEEIKPDTLNHELPISTIPEPNKINGTPNADALEFTDADEEQHDAIQPTDLPTPRFKENEEISLRVEPTKRGIIRNVMALENEHWNYEVYFSQNEIRIFEENELEKPNAEVIIGYDREFLRDLLILKLQKPLEDNLYSAYASKTKFEVYQFKPAIKFLRNISQRLLIADEVGLGKTIEAGIIYLELQARLQLARVLIICPSGLRYKWQDEFKSRFDEDFDVLDKQTFIRFVERYNSQGENTRLRGIVSLELMRAEQMGNLIRTANIQFDLVIIDEAHHCRNSETLSFRLAALLEERSYALLLLTATPLQTSNQDLFNLLKIMEPGEFDEFTAFESRLSPNTYINEASHFLQMRDHHAALCSLKRVEHTDQRSRFITNPYYRELINLLEKPELTNKELIFAQRNIQDLNTLSLFFTRTRKRDVVIKPPIRTAKTIIVPFSDEEMEYYENVIRFIKAIYIMQHPGTQVYTWVTIMKERQVASCLSGFHRQFQRELQQKYEPTTEEETFDFSAATEEAEDFLYSDPYRKTLGEIANFLKNWQTPTDTKFRLFIEAVKGIFEKEPESKIIVFSYFIGTVDYLYDMLNSQGMRTLKMHGGKSKSNSVDERQKTIENFRDNPEIRVLVSSDVGAEGLDFQFCDTIFNYDLPWNPMRVEQRIGRIDRFGQLSPRVRIYNFVIKDTIEERILLRLYERIGLFKHAIGDIEEILGEEINELAKILLSKKLTAEEEAYQFELTARNIERREQELEEFEQKKLQFMGQDAIFANQVQQTLDAGGYVSKNEMAALVETFVEDCDPLSKIEFNPEKDGTYCLRVNDHLNAYIRNFIMEERKGDLTCRSFLERLRSGHEYPLTYTSEVAFERKPLEFVTARHAIAQSAVHYWRSQPPQGDMFYKVRVSASKELIGEYHFFIFLLENKGFKTSIQLLPIVVNAISGKVNNKLGNKFLRLVQNDLIFDKVVQTRTEIKSFDNSRQAALKYIASIRKEQTDQYQKENEMLVNARRTALSQSYEAKKRRIEGAKAKTMDTKIQRMREGELRNLTSRYQFEINKLVLNDVVVSFMLQMQGYLIINSEEPID